MNQRAGGLFLAALIAIVPTTAPAAHAQEWARKMFNKLDHDFGDVAKGAKVEYRFQIKNLYQEDMRISSVRASCGCTIPSVTNTQIKSGETSELVAKFNTDKFEGQHGATLTVRFAPPFAGEVRLQVRGYVRRDVIFYPGRIEFGTVDSGAGTERHVKVYYAGRSDWQIEDIRSTNQNFVVDLKPGHRGGGRVEYDLVFRLKKDAPPGYFNDRLTVVTNDRNRSTIPLAVEGRVMSPITVSPTSLQLGTLRPGDVVSKQIIVRGKTPFKVLSVACESGDECFRFQPSAEARMLHMIPVTYTAANKTGKFDDRIYIKAEGSAGALPPVLTHVEVRAASAP